MKTRYSDKNSYAPPDYNELTRSPLHKRNNKVLQSNQLPFCNQCDAVLVSENKAAGRERHSDISENLLTDLSEDLSTDDEKGKVNVTLKKHAPKNKSKVINVSESPSKSTKVKGEAADFGKSTSYCLPIICIAVVFAVIAYAFIHSVKHLSEPSTLTTKQSPNMFQLKLKKEIKTLRLSFPLQPNSTWINIIAAFDSISEAVPSQPAVLLFTSPNNPDSVKTMFCLAKQLSKAINHIFGKSIDQELMVHSREIVKTQKMVDPIKRELSSRIESILNQSFSVVLTHLELLPPKSVLALHGFCDNFLAPFKKRMIILTAAFDAEDNYLETSQQVDRLLRRLWDNDLGSDASASLVSRLSNIHSFIKADPNINCL